MTPTEREQTLKLLHAVIVINNDQDYTMTQLKRDLRFMASSSLSHKTSELKDIINEILQ
jgi:hypothetical protein